MRHQEEKACRLGRKHCAFAQKRANSRGKKEEGGNRVEKKTKHEETPPLLTPTLPERKRDRKMEGRGKKRVSIKKDSPRPTVQEKGLAGKNPFGP